MACYLQAVPVGVAWPHYILRDLGALKYQNTVGRSRKTQINDLQSPLDSDVENRMLQLPPEILRIIQEHVFNNSRHDFVASLAISQIWAAAATQLLWRDVVLEPSNISSFSASVVTNPQLARQVQSLTFNLVLQSDFTFRPTYEKELIEIVRRLPGLRIFSFIGSSDSESPCPVNNAFVQDLLLSFPATLSSLDIDVNCLKSRNRSKLHTCDLVRRLLPQLEHLRLKGLVCCQDLFRGVPSCPKLRSVIINDSRRSYLAVCKRISSELWRSDYVGEVMAREARKVVEAGQMPNLQLFNIQVMANTESDQNDVSDDSTDIDLMVDESMDRHICIQSKDILANQSFCYPFALINDVWNLWLFTRASKQESLELKFSDLNQIITFVERLAPAWFEDEVGSRRPPKLSSSIINRLQEYVSTQHDLLLQRQDNSSSTQNRAASGQLVLMHRGKIMNPSVHAGLGQGSVVNRDNYLRQGSILVEKALVEAKK